MVYKKIGVMHRFIIISCTYLIQYIPQYKFVLITGMEVARHREKVTKGQEQPKHVIDMKIRRT